MIGIPHELPLQKLLRMHGIGMHHIQKATRRKCKNDLPESSWVISKGFRSGIN